MLLTLPRIDPAVPTTMVFGGISEGMTRLALAMVDAGMIAANDVASFAAPLDALALRDMVMACWAREIGDRMTYRTLSAAASMNLGDERISNEDGVEMLDIAFSAGMHEFVYAEKAMTALEAQQPGLGRFVLSALDDGLGIFNVRMTPMGALDLAAHYYWQGEDDETGCEDGEEEEDDIVRRAKLFRGIPDWAYERSGKMPIMPCGEAEQALTRITDNALRQLLTKATDLSRAYQGAIGRLPEVSDEFEPSPEYLAVVRWNEADDLLQVFDDHYQAAMQGETDWCLGHLHFGLSPEGLGEAKKRLDATFRLFTLLDQTLTLLQEY